MGGLYTTMSLRLSMSQERCSRIYLCWIVLTLKTWCSIDRVCMYSKLEMDRDMTSFRMESKSEVTLHMLLCTPVYVHICVYVYVCTGAVWRSFALSPAAPSQTLHSAQGSRCPTACVCPDSQTGPGGGKKRKEESGWGCIHTHFIGGNFIISQLCIRYTYERK